MFGLLIDGEVIRIERFQKPLIEEMDHYARSAGFDEATIRRIGTENEA